MSSAKKVAINTGLLLAAEIINKIISFVLIVALTRYLGDKGLGIYSFVLAFTGIFTILSNFGLTTYLVREIAGDKKKTKKYFNNIFTLQLVLIVALTSAAIVTALFLKKFSDVFIIIVIAAIGDFFGMMIMPLKSLFTSYEEMQHVFIISNAERIAAFLMGFTALFLGFGLKAFMLTYLISKAAAFLIGMSLVSKFIIKIKLTFDIEFWKFLIKNSIPFWFSLFFIKLFFRIDTLILSMLKTYEIVGWYSAAFRIVDSMSVFSFLIVTACFPVMSKFFKNSKELLTLIYKKINYYLIIVVLPAAAGLFLLSERVILFIYKNKFAASADVLKVLSIAMIFIFINYSLGYLLNTINKQKIYSISTGISALANLILNLLLIPSFSYMGAAAAALLTHIVNFSILYYNSHKNGFKVNFLQLAYKPIIAVFIMSLMVIYFKSLHILLIIPIASASYFCMLIILKCFGKDEINLIKSFIPIFMKQKKEPPIFSEEEV